MPLALNDDDGLAAAILGGRTAPVDERDPDAEPPTADEVLTAAFGRRRPNPLRDAVIAAVRKSGDKPHG